MLLRTGAGQPLEAGARATLCLLMDTSSRAAGRSLGLEGSRILNSRALCRRGPEAVVLILYRRLSFAEAAVVWGAFLRHARMRVLAMAPGVSQRKRNKIKLVWMLLLSQPLNLALSVGLDLVLVVLLMRVYNTVVGGISNHKRRRVIRSSIQLLVD
ncbi:hypothetical protein HDV57DRAFT_58885 [Trichoderma longibrachiatum]